MSLKITVEIDGQTEQQLAPLVGQLAARSPWLAVEAKEETTAVDSDLPQDLQAAYRNNAAILQQQIQQLSAQNQQLQAQLAGAPEAKALSPASGTEQGTVTQMVGDRASLHPTSEPPALPAQYQLRRRHLAAWRLGRSLARMPAQFWQMLHRLVPKSQWLLLFLLMCGCTYALLAVMPRLVEQIWPAPEFVDSDGSGPGSAATLEENAIDSQTDEQVEDTSSHSNAPASATSKAGSHPPPPPAFQQPQ